MSTGSKIEWTETTWNPIAGCAAVSEGCTHCYAATMTRRLEAMGRPEYAGLVGPHHFNGTVRCLPERLEQPLHWRKPRRVFVNSMSDLFHEDVPFEFIHDVLAIPALCPQHTCQILTKRPERAAKYYDWVREHHWANGATFFPFAAAPTTATDAQCEALRRGFRWPLLNVWLGTSIENQATADERSVHLRKCPATVLWYSVEPLLGPIDHLPLDGIGWCVVGGESGPKARPMHPVWVRSIRNKCQAAGVPFFFKQWGEWAPTDDDNMPQAPWRHLRDDGAMGRPNGLHGPQVVDVNAREDECDKRRPGEHLTPNGNIVCMSRYGKKAAGRVLDGRTWDEYPAGKVEKSKSQNLEQAGAKTTGSA
jgi:protein gp37